MHPGRHNRDRAIGATPMTATIEVIASDDASRVTKGLDAVPISTHIDINLH